MHWIPLLFQLTTILGIFLFQKIEIKNPGLHPMAPTAMSLPCIINSVWLLSSPDRPDWSSCTISSSGTDITDAFCFSESLFCRCCHNSSWVLVAFVGSGRIRRWVLCHRRWVVEKVLVFCRWVVGESNGRGGGRHVYRNLNFLVIVGARKPNSWVPERSVGLCGAHAIGHLHFLHQHFLSSGGVWTFLGFRMVNSVNLLRHLNSHNHQLTWLRCEEINFLAAWIELTGSKFWATEADVISSECSRNFLLHLTLYDRASISLLSVIKNGRALVLGVGTLVGLRQF